ncbi:isoprenylcysteine carboxylmethyltransferase family protein [Promineifilum sp.]|uniref:methyltransferase family protein n=1 Tax=Promineifilum sp. TaxID=2664178 RepID=UPI0035B305D4
MSHFYQWAQREYPLAGRIAVTGLAGLLFAVLIPLVVSVGGPRIDAALHLPNFRFGVVNYVVGVALAAVGFYFALWAIAWQLTRGRGTPLPVMPTQTLLTQGPFRYCRNPMSFGALTAYLGFAVAAGTIFGAVLVVCLSTLLILYLRRIEESELVERFGEAYLSYKREVPFLIPRIR